MWIFTERNLKRPWKELVKFLVNGFHFPPWHSLVTSIGTYTFCFNTLLWDCVFKYFNISRSKASSHYSRKNTQRCKKKQSFSFNAILYASERTQFEAIERSKLNNFPLNVFMIVSSWKKKQIKINCVPRRQRDAYF